MCFCADTRLLGKQLKIHVYHVIIISYCAELGMSKLSTSLAKFVDLDKS